MRLIGRPSLVRRLILLAAVWSLVVMAIAGVLLTAQFRRLALTGIDSQLAALADGLFARVGVGEDGAILMPALPDLRFDQYHSGRYWQISEINDDGSLERVAGSLSLDRAVMPPPAGGVAALRERPGRAAAPWDSIGPDGRALRATALYARSVPGHPTPLVIQIGFDRSEVDAQIQTFGATITTALVLLGLFIVVGIWFQVRVGLQPLFNLQEEVALVRKGRADKVERTYPRELAPLAEELNALVAHNQEVVERQRTHVGNLAHALKTPISVMLTEARANPGPLADVVVRQGEAMHGHVEHHLRRARAAARAQSHRELTPIAPVVEELARTLERIFRAQNIAIDWRCPAELAFQGERQDLLEMVGNVMENACKWSAGKVRVTAEAAGPTKVAVLIEDDGPGLPADRRAEVLKRGARLDEKTPGSGLGLSIVDDLARAYGGELQLGDSALGGLAARLMLPRAHG